MGDKFHKEAVINVNGEILTSTEAKISVFDRGFLFGDSVYEVTRTYAGVPFLLDDHINRLFRSASKLHMNVTYTRDEIMANIFEALSCFYGKDCYIRVILTRGEGEISLNPTENIKNNLVVIVKELKENPTWWYKKGVNLVIVNSLRPGIETFDPNVKTGNYLNNVMAHMQAVKQEAFDAILLNKRGFVSESTTSNIWTVKDKKVVTPTLKAGILEGITRKTLLKLARENNFEVHEANFEVDYLLEADECFLTSTNREIVPVIKINDTKIGIGRPGTTTLKLMAIYRNFVHGLDEL